LALLCGLGIAGLIVDRVYLIDPADAIAAVPFAPAEEEDFLLSRTLSASDGHAGITRKLQRVSHKGHRQVSHHAGCCDAPEGGSQAGFITVDAGPVVAAQDRVAEFSTRRLGSIIPAGRGGAAVMIGGRILHVGQRIDDFTLVAVHKQYAEFQGLGAAVHLGVSGNSRISKLPATATSVAEGGLSGE